MSTSPNYVAPDGFPHELPDLSAGNVDDVTFRLLADALPTLCWVANGDGYIVWYNRRWHDYCGTTPAQMEGWGWTAVHHPELLSGVMERWTAAVSGGEPFEMTFPLRGANGTYRPFLTRAQPVRDAAGRVARWFGVNTEVAGQVAAEEALRAERDRSRAVLDGMAEGFALLDPDFRILDLNAEAMRLETRPREALLGQTHWEAYPGSEASELGRQYKLAMTERRPVGLEHRHLWEDGRAAWLEMRAFPVADGLAIFYRDVTARKEAELALRASEARLRAVVGTAPVGIVLSDARGAIYDGNARTEEILGHPVLHSRDADSYGEWVSFHPGGRRVESREYPLARALAGEELPDLVCHYQRGDGRCVWVRIVGSAVRDEDGAITGGIVVVVDIDDERRAQEALKRLNTELEDRVASAVADLDRVWRNARDMFIVIDREAVFLRVNPATTAILGWREDELVGRSCFDFIMPEAAPSSQEALNQARNDVLPLFENSYRTKDGGERRISWVAAPEGDQIYAYGRDVTAERAREEELERAREALRQSQKMETVGQLTGGVAHDFNNLLQIVTGNLETLQRGLRDDQPRLRRAAENAQTGARRAAILTQRLLAFSRRQPLDPKPIDANRLVGDMSELLHRTLGEMVRLETVLASGLWRAEADPNQLENALLNLAVNARDAMEEGGRLTVETANAHLDRAYTAGKAEVRPGQYVVICVSDTGSGMDAATAARVFEPFFTTKEVGRGTGLGLSMVYGFAKQSGGHVAIYSEVGQGTTVKLYLPRLIGEAAPETEAAEPIVPEGASEEVILVCEDDDDVRAYSVDSLRELGYRVLEAHDGPSALRLLARPEGRVDLLFSDVVLPGGLTGADLAAEARVLRPGLPVLFTTGYARDAIVHQGRLDAGVELLTKPFTYADLAARVRDVIDGSAKD
ncbi:PAS domain S-box protein [uncultured Sphingomonas sp.]|uniref:PAS domain S-box protein n=1 Tax=uncultured Sphingomonas sp. TaxID=158754 RepID=UPI0035CB0461